MDQSVTCVIPVRNGASTVERAVDSAFEAGCDYVLAYDDASTDDTLHVMCELRSKQWLAIEKMPHEVGVKDHLDLWARRGVLSLPSPYYNEGIAIRSGACAARNFLITKAPHGLIICLDADDELVNIQPLIEAYEPNTFVYGNHYEINGDSVTHHNGAPIGSLPNKLVTGVTFLFAKEDWKKIGGFDPDFAVCEDYGFMCALVNAGVRGKYVDTTVYNRYLKPEGNERTSLARDYWTFYHDMARRKYPAMFAQTR